VEWVEIEGYRARPQVRCLVPVVLQLALVLGLEPLPQQVAADETRRRSQPVGANLLDELAGHLRDEAIEQLLTHRREGVGDVALHRERACVMGVRV